MRRAFWHGAAELLDTPEGLVPVRFTHSQMAYFEPLVYRFRTLERLCGRCRTVRCIDGLSLVPHLPAFYADGLHPNDEGFLHMALSLAKRAAEPR